MHLISDSTLSPEFCFRDDSGEVCLKTVIWELGRPFALIIFISHLALWLDHPLGLQGVLAYALIALTLLVSVFVYMRRQFKRLLDDANGCDDSDERKKHTFKYSFWFTLSVLLNQISMLIMYELSGSPTGWPFIILTLICTLGCIDFEPCRRRIPPRASALFVIDVGNRCRVAFVCRQQHFSNAAIIDGHEPLRVWRGTAC